MNETDADPVDGADAADRDGADAADGDDIDAASESRDWRPILIRTGHVLGVLVLLAIVLPFVLYAVPQVIGAEASYVVTSPSMEPKLSAYDVIFVNEVDPASIEEGDVINYRRSSDPSTTTHQVLEVVEQDGATAFRTIGINNEGPDPGVVTPDEFRGRVMTVGGAPLAIPYVGRIIQFASSGPGFVLMFVIPVLLLVLNEIWNVVSAARSDGSASPQADGGSESTTGAGGETPVESDESGVVVSANEVGLALLVLVPFTAYSGWIAVGDPGPLTIGVTGSAAAAFLLLGGLYAAGRSGDSEPRSPREGEAEGVLIRTESVPTDADTNVEHVETLDTLIALAETTDGRFRRDPDDGIYSLATADARFVFDPASVEDGESPEPNNDEIEDGNEELGLGELADAYESRTPAAKTEGGDD